MAHDPKIRVAVSACLLGERVRYDGDTKPHTWVRDVLSREVTLVPVCPETELGMSVPREPVDLMGDPGAPRMIGVTSGEDWTERMNAWCRRRIAELTAEGLDGIVLKSRSPSCGVGTAALYPEPSAEPLQSDGLFTKVFRETCPDLVIVEDEDLESATDRQDFLAHVQMAAARRCD